MLIPGYRIIRLLGEGGMAKVWLAMQDKFEREVALKIMSPILAQHNPNYRERFVREARIIAQLMHPNIVTIFDVGVHDNLHYIAMEYVPGRDLKQRSASMTLRDNLLAVKDIALALDFAHQKNYVHRDIKPENILIHERDGRAVLTDFGIARLAGADEALTQTGVAIGTPAFMSPEQAMGRATDARSDLYSLGAVLFYLLAGRVPYTADSAVAIGIKHAMEPIPKVPEELATLQSLIDWSMAKLPDQRFQSGQAFALAINDAVTALTPTMDLFWQQYRQQVQNNEVAAPEKLTQLPESQLATQVLNATKPVPPPRPVNADAAIKKVNVGISRSPVQSARPKSRAAPPIENVPTAPAPPLRLRRNYTTLSWLMVFAPLLAQVLASLSLFKTTGGRSVYFTAADLVLFLGYSTGIVSFWLIGFKLAHKWPVFLTGFKWLQSYVLPLSSLIATLLLSVVAETMLAPLLGPTFYRWIFIVLLLLIAVWIELLVLGRATALTRRLGP